MQSLPGAAPGLPFVAKKREPVPSVLSIAGFDPSSGAGFTADLKVFAAHGLYGLACPTALTVQSTRGVRRSEPVHPALVTDTLDCLAEDIAIAGVKIGMLASVEIVAAVAGFLSRLRTHAPTVPIVLDPVIRSSSGRLLLDMDGLAAVRRDLLPLATVVTPNHAEALLLAGGSGVALAAEEVATRAGIEQAADAVLRMMNPTGAGPERQGSAVIVTGGDRGEQAAPADFLLEAHSPDHRELGGPEVAGTWLTGTWVNTSSTHGTGCAFSAALLCGLVGGLPVAAAARQAKAYVEAALTAAYPVGQGRGPMHHLFSRKGQD